MTYDEVKFAADAVKAYKRAAILKTHNEVALYMIGLIWGSSGETRSVVLNAISTELHKWVSQSNPVAYI